MSQKRVEKEGQEVNKRKPISAVFSLLSIAQYTISVSDILDTLKCLVAKAPSDPGVYKWLNKDGDVLYIGKAKNLKNRLKSYTAKEPDKSLGPWKLSLIRHIADVDITVTQSELEALVLETNLIKELRPRYNVMMKDDKNYVYVRISIQDSYPCIDIVRKMEDDNAKYFGPYTTAYSIRNSLNLLHTLFPYKACKESLKSLNSKRKAESGKRKAGNGCLEYHIGQCCGLCIGALSSEEYGERIQHVMRFLQGNHDEAVRALKAKMQEFAAKKKFEDAAKLRDALATIEKMQSIQQISDTSGEDLDVFGIALLKSKAHIVVLKSRNGKLIDEVSLSLAGESESEEEALSQFLPQFYESTQDLPGIIILGEEIDDTKLLEAWLSEKKGKKVSVQISKRGKKSKLLELAEKNAEQKVKQLETKWESAAENAEKALRELQDALELSNTPKRIECYDISHLGGTETVGSMVVAKNGKAANKEYRNFTIRSLKEGDIDDYKALEEVLRRRLNYLVQDLKQEELSWKELGITFGKARKTEQKALEEILQKEQELSEKNIDYKNFFVARSDEKIIGLGQIILHEKTVPEISSIWIADLHRGKRLGQFLVRYLIKKSKQEKLYITVDPKLEHNYSEIGFRHLHTPPKAIQKELDRIAKEESYDPGFAMVYITKDHKDDPSLKSKPDLLVIDGGKGQLSSIVKVLQDLKLEIPVIGLAKREEEVFIPGKPVSIEIPKDTQGSFLLQRLRNEAHRFANDHRKKRLSSKAFTSELDSVPGIGPETKKALLKKFKTVKGVKDASDEELLDIINQSQLQELRKL